jgi:hypothetical protein
MLLGAAEFPPDEKTPSSRRSIRQNITSLLRIFGALTCLHFDDGIVCGLVLPPRDAPNTALRAVPTYALEKILSASVEAPCLYLRD